MMNLLEAEDTVKGMPDAMLIQQMQNPTGQIPSYLMASELQRRKDMRNRYQAQQQQPTGTVAQRIVAEASAPQMPAPQAPPQMPAPQMPQAPRISPAQMGGIAAVAPGVQRMASGGQVKRMQVGGLTGMPGEGSLMGLTIKAKQMARDLGISFEEAMERLKIQAQMNMPNYSMIAPSGIGFENMRPEMRLPENAGMNLDGVNQLSRDANTQGSSFPDVAGFLRDQAIKSQMNMPNYSMIAPSGMGFDNLLPANAGSNLAGVNQLPRDINTQTMSMPDIPALIDPARARAKLSPSLGSIDVNSMIPREVPPMNYDFSLPANAGFNLGGVNQLPRDTNTLGQDSIESFAESAENYLANSPVGRYAQAAKAGVADVYQDKGLPAASAEAIKATLGGIPALIQTNFEALRKPISDSGVGQGIADFGKQLFSGVPEALGFPMKGDVPPVTPVVDQSEPPKLPAASPQNQGMTGKSVQGTGSALQEVIPTGQQRGIPTGIVDTLVSNAGQQFAGDSSLDMSDLVAQQQRNAVASALMQLGSGIIGRDYGGGAARAAEAFAQGNQAAQDIAMKERVAKYRAAADERKLAEDVRQFDASLQIQADRINQALTVSGNESKRAALRAEIDLLKEEFRNAITADQKAEINARAKSVLDRYKAMLGIPVSQPNRGAASSQRQRSGQDILVQYNAE